MEAATVGVAGAVDMAEEVEEGEVMGEVEVDMDVVGDGVDMAAVAEVDTTRTSASYVIMANATGF